MGQIHIASTNSTYAADIADTTYILDFKNAIKTSGVGILAAPAATGRTLLINGEVHGNAAGMSIGTHDMQSVAVTVNIGDTGEIYSANMGLVNYSDSSHITNAGSLAGDKCGLDSYGDHNRIDNTGILSGNLAVSITGDDNVLVNSGVITGSTAISMADYAQDNTVINRGTLSGGVNAVLGSMEDDRIVNYGRMYGGIALSDGNDTFISNGGFVSGAVRGGNGDDIFILNKGKVHIVEYESGGVDEVKTSQSYTLGDGLENLHLTGKTNVNGNGNLLSNALTGNAGNNRLFGDVGMDFLSGGRGTDRLTGGTDADIFIFKSNADREIVMDFKDGDDHIRFYGGDDVHTLSDLLAHHVEQVKGDLVIEANGTEMILKGIHASDLTSADFYTAQF